MMRSGKEMEVPGSSSGRATGPAPKSCVRSEPGLPRTVLAIPARSDSLQVVVDDANANRRDDAGTAGSPVSAWTLLVASEKRDHGSRRMERERPDTARSRSLPLRARIHAEHHSAFGGAVERSLRRTLNNQLRLPFSVPSA